VLPLRGVALLAARLARGARRRRMTLIEPLPLEGRSGFVR
jgi:hypothetical protein